ncbi:MAG: adenosine deaminase [Treponema sp.]|nr:adenosine deaminase [Treponema sp.]
MNKSEFKTFLRSVPKAEIHIHIEAVISLAGIKKMYKNRFGKEMTKEEQTELFSYNDLNGFIQAFLKVQDLFVSEKDFNIVFKELEKYLVKNGVSYCEAFFAPSAFIKKGFSYKKMVEIFHKQISRIKEKHGITIKLLMDVSRTFGCENAMKNYEMLKSVPCEDIIGIGLGGAESKGPAKDFAPVYELALKEGYKAVAHAGEDVGPESIWDSINYLHSQRIGHGITAIQDEKLMDYCVQQKLPFEVCITSNTFTKKVVKLARFHPIRKFFDKGMLVTVNTDDPVFFMTTLLDEYWICSKSLKFTMDEIKQLIKNSFIASFISDNEKTEYCNQVEAAFAKLQ